MGVAASWSWLTRVTRLRADHLDALYSPVDRAQLSIWLLMDLKMNNITNHRLSAHLLERRDMNEQIPFSPARLDKTEPALFIPFFKPTFFEIVVHSSTKSTNTSPTSNQRKDITF
jgi:hypothetical protein